MWEFDVDPAATFRKLPSEGSFPEWGISSAPFRLRPRITATESRCIRGRRWKGAAPFVEPELNCLRVRDWSVDVFIVT